MSCWTSFCRPWCLAGAWAIAAMAGALAQPVDGMGLMPSDQGAPTLRAPEPLLSRQDQIWELASVMGQAVPLGEPPVRLLMRAGTMQMLDGCNRFSGRFTHDPQGVFRLSSLRGTHNDCSAQSRQAVGLNSALIMANRLQLGEEMVLLSGDAELARLVPSRRQDADAKDEFRFSLVDGPRVPAVTRTAKAKGKASKAKASGSKPAKAAATKKAAPAKKKP